MDNLWLRRGRWLLAAVPLFAVVVTLPALADDPEALSFGGGNCGRLLGGEPLPCPGKNFEAFTKAACVAGRNYLHPLVQQTVVDAFGALEITAPDRQWQYGEMGKLNGGSLWPHKSHQNGLSADFFVPVVDAGGRPSKLPISAVKKLGYGLQFDKRGQLGGLSIDWKALAAHLLALEAAGKEHGVVVERIILTPDFHERLFREAPELTRLRPRFMKREAWVRHDEHYHVDFKIPQKLRRPYYCKR